MPTSEGEIYLSSALNHLRREGLVRAWEAQCNFEQNAVNLLVEFLPGRSDLYTLTAYEVMVDGGEAVIRLARIIQERAIYESQLAAAVAPPPSTFDENARDWWTREYLATPWVDIFMTPSAGEITSPQSIERSRDLFRAVAGGPSCRLLEGGRALPVRGSAGGQYFLFRRVTYCVENAVGDRYCAVVPGVPLWDHLLGVKLMIEHDEPKFLRVANVAGGPPAPHSAWGEFYG